MAKNKPNRFIFAHSYWDIIPVFFGIAHLAYLLMMFVLFEHLPWWANVLLALVYAVSISWNINGISHNFIHNAYFKSEILNRIFSLIQSVTMVFSQTFYDNVHRRHHVGNSDLPDAEGKTRDPLSIYLHGKDGQPENVWAYTFKSYFRDDPGEIFNDIKRRSSFLAWYGVFEIAVSILVVIIGFALNWKFMLFMVPFYYLGHSFSSLNGFYEHYKGNPNLPIAWGVSSYSWLYNFIWFNNGYHAEHHYRPSQHWTQMKTLHKQLADKQKEAGVHVIKWSHGLGFLQDLSKP
jgi:fatty acid desaturase